MRKRHLAVALTFLGFLATGCGGGGDGVAGSPTAPAGRYASLHRGLCDTATHARDVGAARRIFFDRAHQPLHELAAAAAGRDRSAAARLLEAKEAVEEDLEMGSAALPRDVDRLVEATRRAIAATGEPPPATCEETS